MFSRISKNIAVIALFLTMVILLGFVSIVSAVNFNVNEGDSIQYVIDNNASDGDTIYVNTGTYFENLYIDKKITLTGVSNGDIYPVIDGGQNGNCIYIIEDGVSVNGFVTINSTVGSTYAGIYIRASNCDISEINSNNNGCGFYIYDFQGMNRIYNSSAENNKRNGISLLSSHNNILFNIRVIDNLYSGLKIESSSGNQIYNNYFDSSGFNGNIDFAGIIYSNIWNITKTSGNNILGGPFMGGNYYSNLNDNNYPDNNEDGFSDVIYIMNDKNTDFLPLKDYIPTPPGQVSDLKNSTYEMNFINWTWTDPKDPDLKEIKLTSEGFPDKIIQSGTEHYNMTGLLPDTLYSISVYTIDENGAMNETPVMADAKTAQDLPPGCISNMTGTTGYTWINLTWTDPSDDDFNLVKIECEDCGTYYVNKTVQFLNVTSLIPSTEYTFSAYSIDNNNHYSTQVVVSVCTLNDATPLTGILNLNGNANNSTSITWQWTNPSDPELEQVIVNFKGDEHLLGNATEFFTASALYPDTVYDVNVTTRDLFGIYNNTGANFSVTTEKDMSPLTAVTDLTNSSYASDYIYWTWTDPKDPDLFKVVINFNGKQYDIMNGTECFNATGLISNKLYNISAYTVDIFGFENKTFENTSSITKKDSMPPLGIKNLINSTFARDYILWTWNEPADSDLTGIMFSFENTSGVMNYYLEKGICRLNISGLIPDTEYRLNSTTIDSSGNVNSTIISSVSKTAPDMTLLTSVSDLKMTNNGTDYVIVNWTEPDDPDFKEVLVYINSNVTAVPAGIRNYKVTDLLPDTKYNIGTKTVDIFGHINSTWMNISVMTSSDGSVSPANSDNTGTVYSSAGAGGGGTDNSAYTYTNTGPLSTSSEGKILRNTIISSSAGPSRLSLVIPINTIVKDINGNPVGSITITPLYGEPEPVPEGSFKFAGIVFTLKPDDITFDPSVKIIIHKEDLPVNNPENNEYLLKYYNELTSQWEDINTRIDTNSGTIIAEISHFSKYALFYKTPEIQIQQTGQFETIAPDINEEFIDKPKTDEKTTRGYIDLILMFSVTLIAVISSIYLIRTEVYKMKFFKK